MTPLSLLLSSLALAPALGTGPTAPVCLPAAPEPGPGSPDPFAAPAPKATELNAAGKTLYRQGKWEEARAQYRAALAADPGFLAPRLNVACSFVRQERFAEAAAEARALVESAYVPWSREVLEAADLGALKVRPEMAGLRQAMTAAAARWGEGLAESLVFVARQRAPLRVPEQGPGVFILNPHQEAYAFSPATGRVRQLTAEDGHVVALARSPDGRRLIYVTAEKLVRDAALRGVALGELTLATMTLAPPIRLEGDVRRLEIASGPRGIMFRVEREGGQGRFLRGEGGTLVPLGGADRPIPPLAVLTARGALPSAPVPLPGPCGLTARERSAGDGTRAIELERRGRPARKLGEHFGAGLAGLPIP
jgi:hypothetical protein